MPNSLTPQIKYAVFMFGYLKTLFSDPHRLLLLFDPFLLLAQERDNLRSVLKASVDTTLDIDKRIELLSDALGTTINACTDEQVGAFSPCTLDLSSLKLSISLCGIVFLRKLETWPIFQEAARRTEQLKAQKATLFANAQ